MSTPAPPPSVEPGTPTPPVPYGPAVGAADENTPTVTVTAEGLGRTAAKTAGKWALRVLVLMLVRALVRVITRG